MYVAMLWSACAWQFLFVYFVSQCIHALRHSYTPARFLLEIFSWRLLQLLLHVSICLLLLFFSKCLL